MRSIFFLSLLFVSLASFAQEEDCADDQAKKLMNAVKKTATEEPASACPNPKKVKNLCMFIDGRTVDSDNKFKFKYQKQIQEASCVTDSDNKETKNKKIQAMWAKFENQLICNNLQFDVPNGNVIKYAANSLFDEFIYDVSLWKVNLNKVDETDGRTVLDYLKYKIELKKGTPLAEKLQHYYKVLKDAGAKHKNEL